MAATSCLAVALPHRCGGAGVVDDAVDAEGGGDRTDASAQHALRWHTPWRGEGGGWGVGGG